MEVKKNTKKVTLKVKTKGPREYLQPQPFSEEHGNTVRIERN